MKLNALLKNLDSYKVYGDTDVVVKDIADDSRKVKKGYVFVAIKGDHTDSHDFIDQTIKNGAVVIVGEKAFSSKWKDVTYVRVKDSREALGVIASNWYGNPSSKLKVIGVTGTDGKTTTSNLIYSILKQSNRKTGLITTINAKVGSRSYETGLHVTNPEPLALQKLLSEMVKQKCDYAVLEVTSHGIAQRRIAGIKFFAAVLTNVTHEHLDYHKSFEDYRNTKAKLFENVKVAVLNSDDPSFSHFKKVAKNAKVFTYANYSRADFVINDISFSKNKMRFNILNTKKNFLIKSNLQGEFNAYNITASAALSRALNIEWKYITAGIASMKKLNGRLEKIANDKDIQIYVDFAHTPNSLEKVLTYLKSSTANRLIVVYGCASERDIQKRTLMPQISLKLADISIFTAEDPRREPINQILDQMGKAAESSGGKLNRSYYKIPERGQAIFDAINKIAKEGDTIVICGKGHEKSMSYNGIEYPWSDQDAVRMALKGKVAKIERD